MPESLLSKSSFVSKLLKNKKFRERYVYEQVRNGIPFQIRALRKKHDWSQADLGEAAGKPRPVISRLEDPNYGKLSLKTLFEIASAFEVALLVKFVPFSRLVKEYEDVSWQVLAAPSVTDVEEVAKLEAWSAGSTMPEPVIVAGRGTDKTAALIRRHLEHLTIEVGRKDYVRAPFFRGRDSDPTVTMEGENTQKAAAV
jgi:transcriptional regulator with XRE-family HTH domain